MGCGLLYNQTFEQDILNILEHIDGFSSEIGVSNTPIDTQKLVQACKSIRENFPCIDGIKNASIFKKAAVFVACFVEIAPIGLNAFLESELAEKIKSKNPNAIIALGIAFRYLSLAKVYRPEQTTLVISNGIELSMHSYCDFLDMLSQDINLKSHFMVLSLLFEQVVYKTHNNMQYELLNFAEESKENIDGALYSSTQDGIPPEWDDYNKMWEDPSRKEHIDGGVTPTL